MHINEELFQTEDFKRNLKMYEEAVRTGKTVFLDIDDMTDIIDYYNYDGRIEEATRMAIHSSREYLHSALSLDADRHRACILREYQSAHHRPVA